MKEKVISILFVFVLFGFMILGIIIKDRDISVYERRKLTTTLDLKEDFLENIDDYLTDQFPFRDNLISINSFYERYFLLNKEHNDVYVKDGFIIDKNYPMDEKSLDNFVKKINYVSDNYLSNSNVFYGIIPDKGYFLEKREYLKLDYESILERLKKDINAKYIDIFSILVLDDYFKTDIHIKQDSYFKVIKELDKYLDFNYREIQYQRKTFDEFYGASITKVSKIIKPDKLEYLDNSIFKDVKVNHLEFGYKGVYDLEKLGEVDSYNVFLSGPSALLEIENPDSSLSGELIIFRDSFSSSLTPLLIPFYKKITLIDLRYISDDLISNYVGFDNKDVLFLYSTLIVNNSNTLKVKTY